MSEAKDYIGFDPVRWIERLREVNESSQFNEKDKALIEGHLLRARGQARRHAQRAGSFR